VTMMTTKVGTTTITDTDQDQEADRCTTRTVAGPNLIGGPGRDLVPRYGPFEDGKAPESTVHILCGSVLLFRRWLFEAALDSILGRWIR